MQKPKISVIVLNWNGKKWLKNCFSTLKKQTFDNFEVILADNASTDGSVEFVKKNFPWVKIHRLSRNKGYTGANNSAAKKAEGEYLFFLNNDTKVNKNCLRQLVNFTEKHPKTGIFGCREHTYDGRYKISDGVGCDFLGFPCEGKVFYADGAALLIRNNLFQKLNGFDNKHFIFHEDSDLAWRARLLGWKVNVCKKAIVYHQIGGSILGGFLGPDYTTSSRRRFLSERNTIRNLLKNYSIFTLTWVLPLYFLVNLAEMGLLLITGNFKVALCYPKAWWENVKILLDTLKQREKIQETRKIGDREILKAMEFKIGKLDVLKKVGIPRFQ